MDDFQAELLNRLPLRQSVLALLHEGSRRLEALLPLEGCPAAVRLTAAGVNRLRAALPNLRFVVPSTPSTAPADGIPE